MKSIESHGPVVTESGVMTASVADRREVLDLLVRAFAADPVVRWCFPDPDHYAASFRAFADAFGGRAFDHAAARYVAGFRGAALWLPPGVGPDEETLVPQLERDVPADRIRHVFEMLGRMGGYHPEGPHWYLPLIGVDPAHQSRGHGSALLRSAAERCDRDGLPAYLESTNPRNLPLYGRYGFEVVGTIRVGEAPPIFPMVRLPR